MRMQDFQQDFQFLLLRLGRFTQQGREMSAVRTLQAVFLVCRLAHLQAELSLGVFTINNRHAYALGSMPYSAPAMDLAVEQLNAQNQGSLSVAHTYLFDENARNCDDVTAITAPLVTNYYYTETRKFNVTAAIFPGYFLSRGAHKTGRVLDAGLWSGCGFRFALSSNVLYVVSSFRGCSEQTEVINLTREWKILTMLGATTSGAGTNFRDRKLYPHVISAGPANPVPYVRLILTAFLTYGWKNIYLAYDSSPERAFYKEITLGSVLILRASSMNARVGTILCSANGTFDDILEDFRIHARIFSFAGYPTCTRRLMIAAFLKNMTNGEYVYIVQEVHKNTTVYGSVKWQNNDQYDEIARKAFQSLIVVGPIDPVSDFDLAAFSRKLIPRSRSDYNFTYPAGEQVNAVARALYACLFMFVQVVREAYNDTLFGDSGDVFDGANLGKRFLDRSFQLPTGPIRIDKAGERSEVPGFWFYEPDTMELKPFLTLSPNGSLATLTRPPWPKRWPPPNVPACGYLGNEGPCAPRQSLNTTIIAAVSSAVCVIIIIGATVAFRMFRLYRVRDDWWKLDSALVTLQVDDCENAELTKDVAPAFSRKGSLPGTVYYKNRHVRLIPIPISSKDVARYERALGSFLLKVRTLQHSNVNEFLGILQSDSIAWLVEDHCPRGDLRHLYKHGLKIDNYAFRKGLAADFLRGLKYIHESSVKYHGNIQPRCCLIDSRFTLRIAGAGYDRMLQILQHSAPESASALLLKATEWTAPENRAKERTSTARGDVYSTGMLLLQLVDDFELKFPVAPTIHETIEKDKPKQLKQKKSRPDHFPEEVKNLLKKCISEVPEERPTILVLFKKYFHIVRPSRTVVADTLRRLEHYSEDLENSVIAKTQELVVERQKCDALLCEMLPQSIVTTLRRGNQPAPEFFDEATLSFTDIVGFAGYVAKTTPLEVVDFLTQAHGLFDGTILQFNAYKVESIGDCYLTASGLPARNGRRHAEESCRMAIKFHEVFSGTFDGSEVTARSGIHTGPCIAAVVGLKRPRYCLFGDTINTASRMESSGEAGRIQISDVTAGYLFPSNGLHYTSRGMVCIKGKGEMQTFWLDPPLG